MYQESPKVKLGMMHGQIVCRLCASLLHRILATELPTTIHTFTFREKSKKKKSHPTEVRIAFPLSYYWLTIGSLYKLFATICSRKLVATDIKLRLK